MVNQVVSNEHATQIAEAVLAACKQQVSKGLSLDGVDLDHVVNDVVAKIALESNQKASYRLHEVIYTEDDSPFLSKDHESGEAWMDRTQAMLIGLQEASDSLPEGEIVGGLITFPVADGMAFYKVTQEFPLVIEHIPFGDAYHAPLIMLNGLDTDYIRAELHGTTTRPKPKV